MHNSLEEIILRKIEANRTRIVEFCGALVEADSINPPGRTVDVAKQVVNFLREAGLRPEVVVVDPDTPNIVASLGTKTRPHIVFNGHMDTMDPGNAEDWTVPILSLTRKDNKLYGLGMGNMKGGIAAMCAAMAALVEHANDLRGRVTLTTVSDEVMFGERGTVALLEARRDLIGDYLICAEGPGNMDLAVAEKGLLWVNVEAAGVARHSSRAEMGATAVARLATFLSSVDNMNTWRSSMPSELETVTLGDHDVGGRVSLNAGMISAGNVRSLISPVAKAEIDVRIPPGLTVEDVIQRLEGVAAQCADIRLSYSKAWNPNWTALDTDLVGSMRSVIERIRGTPPMYVVRLPGSDARRWRDHGVPAVCFGPQPTLSSDLDDYAYEQDVVDCAKIYALAALGLMKQ